MLPQLRNLLMNIKVQVIPDQFGLGQANQAFGEGDTLKEPKQAATVEGLAKALVRTTQLLLG
jgi:hypothetical protein